MKDYTALIVDLEKSRSYTPEVRNSIQNYILSVMRALNELYENSLAKEVEFSAGDEVQGLFFYPESAYLYLRMLSMLVFLKVRAGIGIGEWNIKIENESTTAQDGPAYYNARYAINNAKDTSGYPVLIYSGKAEDLFLNAVINASIVLTTNHSEYQNELLLLSELLYPVDYGQAFDFNKIGNIFKLVKSKTNLIIIGIIRTIQERIPLIRLRLWILNLIQLMEMMTAILCFQRKDKRNEY